VFDTGEKKRDPCLITTDPEQHTFGIIEYFAGKPKLVRNVPNRRSEPNALDASSQANFERLKRLRTMSTHGMPADTMGLFLPLLEHSGTWRLRPPFD